MDNLETPYVEDDDFIECRVCEKSLRGETLYKIHLTTSGHIKNSQENDNKASQVWLEVFSEMSYSLLVLQYLHDILKRPLICCCVVSGQYGRTKKEDVLVAEGKAIRQHVVPTFDNIMDYLEYLNLNEPIIGLNYLEEVIGFDPQFGPKYMCKLCNLSSVLAEMVCHVIGRKHRQKYVEFKRPDLVTWDNQTVKTQAGKSIRAKAEIIERQDGRGTPKQLTNKTRGTEGRLNITRVPPGERQYRKQNIPQKSSQDLSPLLPEFKDYHKRKNLGHEFYADEAPMKRQFESENKFGFDRFEEKQGRSDYREVFDYSEHHPNPDYRGPYEVVQQPQNSGILEQHDVPRYNYGEQSCHGQAQDVNYYPTECPPYKRPYPEKDALEEFYSEEVRRGQGDKQWWSMEGESGRHDRMQGLSEPEAKRRNFSAPPDHEQAHHHMFDIVKDYHHKTSNPYSEKTFDNPGTSRERPPSSMPHGEVSSSTMSDIPEPFRRFLKGGANNGSKRKSRFSDASPEELKKANEMSRVEPYAQTGGDPGSGSGPMRPQMQYSDRYEILQNPPFSESYNRGGSEPENVFDVLKNVEIANAEEANFLKSKLCSVLEEFRTKKEKIVSDNQGRAGVSMSYGDLRPDPQPPQAHQYERPPRQESDPRRPEDPQFSHRGRWDRREPKVRHQEFNHPLQRENRRSGGYRYEEEPYYPESLQEPMHPRNYQSPDEFFDPHASAPPPHMELESKIQRDSRYSNNLDKITCALLELVARK